MTRSPSSTNSHPDELLESFVRFCAKFLRTENGQPLEVHPFQRVMLAGMFGGIRETVVIVPKKNGKTTLLGAVALHHLIITPDAEVVVVAASRDQAGIMLRQAQGFIRRSPALQERLKTQKREIANDANGGRIRILASDVDTVDGVIPTLVLVDELHRHKSDELYGILRDGLGPRDGQMVTISTAADSVLTPLGVLRQEAYAQGGVERDGVYRCARSSGMVLHEWALDPDDDVDDLELVKQANPAPWQTIEALRDRHDSASMRPWQWKRFACGLWVSGEDSAISDKEWQASAKPGLSIPNGPEIEPHIGLDLARRGDCTAVVAVWRDPDGVFWIEPLAIIEPPADGTYITEEEIWEPLEAACERWLTATFVADPSLGADIFLERLQREFPNIRTGEYDQKAYPLARMAARFTEQLAEGNIVHPDDPALNAHVLAAAARPVGEGWRFVKQRQKKLPIDAVIAAGMALDTILGEDGPPSDMAVF